MSKKIEIDGKSHTIAEWSRINCIPDMTIRTRINRGWRPSDAVVTPVGSRNPQKEETNNPRRIMITIDGTTHSLAKWAKMKGMHKHTIYTRLKKGLSPQDAIMTPRGQPARPRGILITINGVTKNISQWADANKIGRATACFRIKCGWTPEDAITVPVGQRNPKAGPWKPPTLGKTWGKTLSIDGETKTISQWSKAHGIPRGTIVERIKHGWDDKDAVSITKGYRAKRYTCNGKSYTLAELQDISGIQAQSIYNRIHNLKWSPEKAISTPIGRSGRKPNPHTEATRDARTATIKTTTDYLISMGMDPELAEAKAIRIYRKIKTGGQGR